MDELFMNTAMTLAEKGRGWVNPNPVVGAVIVREGVIIGQGYHERYGGFHAEVNALNSISGPLEGASLYVTLEPCCHYGQTPPCTERIIKSGIRHVVVGAVDPNPLVAGKGIQRLREAGIKVEMSGLGQACEDLNPFFNHRMRTGRPFVTLKYAMTLDGKTALADGSSKWITSHEARVQVHQERHEHMAIGVGIGTLLRDDPDLTCRHIPGKSPTRVIFDTHLRTPLSSKVIQTAKTTPTWLLTGQQPQAAIEPFEVLGVKCIQVPLEGRGLSLTSALKSLTALGVDSLYLEGGPALNASFLNADLVDALHVFIGAKCFGGQGGRTGLGGPEILDISQAKTFDLSAVKSLGNDVELRYRRSSCLQA